MKTILYRTLFILPLIVAGAFAGEDPAEERAEVVWNLADLYPTPEAWEDAYGKLKSQLDGVGEHKGKLGESAESLLAALTEMSALSKELSRLYSYSSMKNDENQTVAESQERLGKARALYTEFGQAVSWVRPEVLGIGEKAVNRFLEKEAGLAPFDHYLRDILRNADHTLGGEAEGVIAAAGNVLSAPNEIYELLVNADVPWPTVTLSTGEEVYLNQAAYTKHRAAPNREDRKLVFNEFWTKWGDYEDSLGMILGTEVNANVFQARVRNYPDTLTMQLAEENIPPEVYRTLVQEVNAGLPTLHRYFKLRARMLGIEQMHYYDIYPPLVTLDKVFDLDTSAELTMIALRPFGDEYIELLKQGIDADWTHAYPAKGKRSGAYMNGSAYDVHPYVLLNHNDDFSSLSTYAHEWGHAVHSLLANAAQPYEKADYSTFTAEIASQINEILLEEHLIGEARSTDEKLFYLGFSLESMRGSFYRQTMFAEFENAIHEAVEGGDALTGSKLTEIYGGILKRYHGHDDGVVLIDDVNAHEWAYIPHFYYDFYVYQYATSIAGAAWFAERLLGGEAGAQQNFIDVLKAGGSDYPYEILQRAGLDMTDPEPYRAAIRRMNDVMDRIEALLDERDAETEATL